MFLQALLALVAITQVSWIGEAVTTHEIHAYYDNNECSGPPYKMSIHSPQNCTPDDTCGTDLIPRLRSTTNYQSNPLNPYWAVRNTSYPYQEKP
jgi:hypothetical protein